MEQKSRARPAFQIIDDVIDLTEGKGRGGEIGCDIKEGKRTILVAHVCSKCTKREKEKLFKILNKGRDKVTKEDINWVIDLYGKYGSIEYVRQKAR